MSYCANCGKRAVADLALCDACGRGPEVPAAVAARAALRARGRGTPLVTPYPGERIALAFCIAVFGVGVLLLGVASLGLILGLIAAAMVEVRLRLARLRRGAVRVDSQSLPATQQLAEIVAYRLRMTLPDLFVVQDRDYNAYAAGFGRHSFIVINSGVIEELEPDEQLFLLGHEFGHVNRGHTSLLNFLRPVTGGVLSGLFRPVLGVVFNIWSVKAEYSADRYGLIACRDIETAARAIVRVSSGTDATSAVEGEEGAGEWATLNEILLEYLGTHPLLRSRLRTLRGFSASSEFLAASSES